MRQWTSISAAASVRGVVIPLHPAVKVIFSVLRRENKNERRKIELWV